jgi:hypothetical protein
VFQRFYGRFASFIVCHQVWGKSRDPGSDSPFITDFIMPIKPSNFWSLFNSVVHFPFSNSHSFKKKHEQIARREFGLSSNHEKFLKGNIFLELVKTLFEKSGYLVVPYGYEKQLISVKRELSKTSDTETWRKIRSSPDLLVLNKDTKELKLVEVKMSSYPYPRLNRVQLENYKEFWDDTILVMVLPFDNMFYSKRIHDLGAKDDYNPNTDFVKIQDMFPKIEQVDLKNFGILAFNLIKAMDKRQTGEIEQEL